ncbi:MAG: SOS response-associated peptidase [Deltaproteobacteria bacterium]|nr:SOS response-associated peptidase [Deltaproteobacteria bacterium]
MCGRYTITEEIEVLQGRFEFENAHIDFKPRYNVAPGQNALVVVKSDSRYLYMMSWGFVPFWAKDESIGYKLINARGETLSEKPIFKRLFEEKRCLVLADGFFEWKQLGKGKVKVPMRFVLKDRRPFAFAGLWDIWQDPQGKEQQTFTIITTGANEIVRPIHDRMPVILKREDEEEWLDPENKKIDRLSSLLKPFPSELMDVYAVSTIVNSTKNDRPECIREFGGQPIIF